MPANRIVALVGRPNVGKSRLFNRLASRRLAIVHDQAGVTRDVNAVEVNNDYTLLDTGGIGLVVDMDHQKLIEAAEEQVWFAVETATVICFVVDGREGLMPLDQTIAQRLRAAGKQIILVVNKIDKPNLDDRALEFSRLGLGDAICVSAEHGRNEDLLREEIAERLGPVPETEQVDAAQQRIRLAFVGRPNVGKSSLCNRLLDDKRMVVSEVPGTTRDSVVANLDYTSGDGQIWPFALVDTAGLRHRGRVSHSVEYFSTVRSHEAVANADIVFVVIDATTGVTRQDKALAGEVVEAGKCVCLLINKWDLAVEKYREKEISGFDRIEDWRAAYAEEAMRELFFLPKSPAVFASAKTGHAMERILRVARQLWEVSGRSLPTPRINQLLEKMTEHRQPKVVQGKRFKVYYTVQTGNRPFVFRMFCNRAAKLEDGYRRYLENGLIEELRLDGCPIRFDLRGKTVRYADMPKKRTSGDHANPRPGSDKGKKRPGSDKAKKRPASDKTKKRGKR